MPLFGHTIYYRLGLKFYLLYFCLREMQIISGRNYSSKVIDLLPYRTLTNFGLCNDVTPTVEKNPGISGPVQFKPMFFNGQL